MNKKSVFRIVITFIVVSALFIAGYFAIDAYTQKVPIMSIRQSKKIGATYMTLNNPFFEIIDEQLQNILSTEGYTLMSLDPVLDLKTQREQIEYLIDQKVDAIVVNPVDYKGLRTVLNQAYKADIPIFTVDTEVIDEDLVTYNIVSDNYDAGVQCAKDMMQRQDKANIVLLEHSTANSACLRIQGFVDTIEGNANYQIIKRIECQGQLEVAMPLMEEYLQENENIDVVMALNDPSALGALAALESQNKLQDVLVYVVDGTPEAKSLINEGRMQATVAQSPETMGKKAGQAILDYFNGKKIQKNVVEAVTIITQNNIQDYSLEGWQ